MAAVSRQARMRCTRNFRFQVAVGGTNAVVATGRTVWKRGQVVSALLA